jgi:L-Ala-D/L-Glu epimerase / N-acetyl-D-glutamate racemase
MHVPPSLRLRRCDTARVQLTHTTVVLPLAVPWRIARGAKEAVELVHVSVTHSGVTGHGEGAPSARYGESAASAQEFLPQAASLLGDDPFALEAIERRLAALPWHGAARAALDAALHDLCGKLAGLPAWRLLGLPRTGPPTSYSVGIDDPDAMARLAQDAAARGFRAVKLKLGAGDALDAERVRAVRRAVDVPVRVDANEGWTLAEALDLLPQLAAAGVECVEQPLPAGDPGGARLKSESALPIYVDEDCRTLADVAACAARAHGINVKLAKSGGIREAQRIIHAGRALGLGIMIGCMVESTLGIAAGCALAGLCDLVDLDGNLLLDGDPWRGVEFRDGVQVPSDAPGLGVHEALPGAG